MHCLLLYDVEADQNQGELVVPLTLIGFLILESCNRLSWSMFILDSSAVRLVMLQASAMIVVRGASLSRYGRACMLHMQSSAASHSITTSLDGVRGASARRRQSQDGRDIKPVALVVVNR